jgi:hypothetical protein
MVMPSIEVTRFESPDEVVRSADDKGISAFVRIGGGTIRRGVFQPGWRWSTHVGPAQGRTACPVRHVGYVVSGCMALRAADGLTVEVRAGSAYVAQPDHDAWVVGDEPCVTLDFAGMSPPTTP